MFAIGSEGQGGLDIFGGELRKIGQDFRIAHASGQPAKNIIHRDPHVSDAGFSATFTGFDRDALAVIVRRHMNKIVRFKRAAKRKVDGETGCEWDAIGKMKWAGRYRRDFGFWILDFGFWILDFGFWILDFGFWILDFGFWILDF
jgi:hypothetical protein